MGNQTAIEIRADNTAEVIRAKDEAIKRALEAIGIHLEGEAKDELQNDPIRIDTGRLRNSITYATAEAHSSGTAPAEATDYALHGRPEKESVYVGSNVEYAPYVHEGTQRMAPNRFLKNAFERNMSQIKAILKRELGG